MSLFVLFMLVFLQPAFGNPDKLFNGAKVLQTKPVTPLRKKLLNSNSIPLVAGVNPLQLVFNDYQCKNCIMCMEYAIKANTLQTEYQSHRTDPTNLSYEIFNNYLNSYSHRNKRDSFHGNDKKVSKKPNKKPEKPMTVTKYNNMGKVYALKIKESSKTEGKTNGSTEHCHIYSVKKTYKCDLDATSLLSSNKKITKNKIKREQKPFEVVSKPPKNISTMQTTMSKRLLDDPNVPETFMSSIEEQYS